MFLRKFHPILKRVVLISALATFALLLAGAFHSFTIASSATVNPDAAMNQKADAQVLVAQSPVTTLAQPAPLASPIAPSEISTSDANTALLFQNDRYAVRIFRAGEQAYVNVYDKDNQTQPLQQVPVSITPAGDPKNDPTKYIATLGDQQYIVLIKPTGASELTILKTGTVTYRQSSNQVEIARKVPGVSAQTEPANPTQEVVKTLFSNFAKLTLFTLMLSMGLRWTFEDVVWLWQQPSLLLRSLFSVLIAVPLLGVIVTLIPGLTVAERIGIGAMIICPGAPTVPSKSLKAGGHEKYVASLQFAVCVLAIVSVPIAVTILAQFYPNDAWLSPQDIAKQIFFAQVLPIGLGVLLAQYVPKLADDLIEPIGKIANLLFLLLAIALLVISLQKVLNTGWLAFLAMVVIAIASLLCGHFLGGPQPDTRTTLAYATVSRNVGLAVLLVSLNFPHLDYLKGGIINTLITYALIAAIVSIPYTTWRKQRVNQNPSFQQN